MITDNLTYVVTGVAIILTIIIIRMAITKKT